MSLLFRIQANEIAFGIDEGVSLASPNFFSHIEAFGLPTNGTRFDRLAINHSSAGLFVSPLLLPHLSAQGLHSFVPDPSDPPRPEVIIHCAPGRCRLK